MTDPRVIERIVRIETVIGIAINALLPTGVIWLVGIDPPEALTGSSGLVQGMLKGSGIAVFAMTLLLTLSMRARMRRGGLPTCALDEVSSPARLLPSNLVARALVMAVVAMVTLVPTGAAVALLLHILPLSPSGFILFNLAFGTIVGLTMTPFVVRRGLADGVPR